MHFLLHVEEYQLHVGILKRLQVGNEDAQAGRGNVVQLAAVNQDLLVVQDFGLAQLVVQQYGGTGIQFAVEDQRKRGIGGS